jgi:putative tricarboxylic transport membrane protein
MDAFSQLLNGFAVALTPMNLLWCLVGTTLGTAIGVLPGLGPALTIALLLPITFKVEPTAAFILFAGIYYGAMYGGSTTSILLNTPGTPSSRRSRVTKWRVTAAPARRSRPRPSALSSPA